MGNIALAQAFDFKNFANPMEQHDVHVNSMYYIH